MKRPSPPPPETTPNWAAGFRRRVPFYIITAVLLAILAGALTFIFLDRMWASTVPTGQAMVAREDIQPGTMVTEDMVEVRAVPEAILPADHLVDVSQAIGRVAVVPISANEVLLPNKFASAPGMSLSARLPDGRWAMVLPSSWFISPVPELTLGDRLDLVAYQSGQPVSEVGVIVSAIEILQFSGPAEKPELLTLGVTFDEAVAILYARINGFTLLALLRPEGG